MRCAGSGTATIVLEPGLAKQASAMAWWIAPAVARTTTNCVYAGAGTVAATAPSMWMRRARPARPARPRARLPSVRLRRTSLGGVPALSYVRRYPAQVGGVVLLDSI